MLGLVLLTDHRHPDWRTDTSSRIRIAQDQRAVTSRGKPVGASLVR
jgi:hypothetical protein